MSVSLGPQGEPIFESRDVSVDGVGFGPTKVPTSAAASGTDRDIVNTEQAVLVGPQGEKIYPVNDSGICPVCGQQFPEAASLPQPGTEPSGFDDDSIPDSNTAPVDDRDDIVELLK